MITNKLTKTDLTVDDFDYDLPREQIAQTPAEPRDSARLLLLSKKSGETEHKIFSDIIDYINPEDVLVINDTKVIPARIIGNRIFNSSIGSNDNSLPVELLLLKQTENDTWECLAGPGKRARKGDILDFGQGLMTAKIIDIIDGGQRLVKFITRDGQTVYDALNTLGTVPLPPYITEKLSDPDKYQTVYAKYDGSAAAPTAGLHFTQKLLDDIKEKGTAIVPVLLHVGLGTFRPVKEHDIEDHEMHSEYIQISEKACETINERKKNGGRVISVGTTSCRTIESCSDDNGILHPYTGETGIYIYPGYKFKITDALITNFHLPKSTLIMLVSALAGRDNILNAYNIAVKEKYRFFSFGDAMFIY